MRASGQVYPDLDPTFFSSPDCKFFSLNVLLNVSCKKLNPSSIIFSQARRLLKSPVRTHQLTENLSRHFFPIRVLLLERTERRVRARGLQGHAQ